MRSLFTKVVLMLVVVAASPVAGYGQGMVIPQPVERIDKQGVFLPGEKTTFYINIGGQGYDNLKQQLELLPFQLKPSSSRQANQVALLIDKKLGRALGEEGYNLEVTKSGVVVKAPSQKGLFYGVQTLRQLAVEAKSSAVAIPATSITDYPRFSYRGMHLDVSRHFYSVDFIKKQLDVMAFYKFNKFHWHLTDGAGWRLEIKAYPELTKKAAWRNGKTWKEWWTTGRTYSEEGADGAYGGYYTRDEVRDIVKYAAERNITVIPEIEMPGHSEEVLAVFPNLSCTGDPHSVGEFCVGNEEVFTFLETVLKEVMDLFPSEFIHVGGDEANKEHWKKCAKCQKRIKDNNLKDEDELQSYMIRRIEQFLSSNGRRLVGWDEILEGGLAKGATVMSWRGEQGGIDAARMGHDVIMTPGEFCYFDQYQDNPMKQPEAIGGYLTIDKVYSYDPVPKELTAKEAQHILGPQANVWTEYMSTPQHTQRMIFPRLLALSEVAWTPVENKDWTVFKTKLDTHFDWLKNNGVEVSPLSSEIISTREVDLVSKTVKMTLFNDVDKSKIYYTTNGLEPNLTSSEYVEPISIGRSTVVTARVYKNDAPYGDVQQFVVDIHKALGKPITVTGINSGYPAAGQVSLVDGKVGTLAYKDQIWQGYTQPMTAVIDMESVQPISYVKARFMQLVGPWIWLPSKVVVSVSDDGVTYNKLGEYTHDIPADTDKLLFHTLGFEGRASGRYIKFEAFPYGKYGAVMFTDEIVVY
jgi:hexosaminidase